jgi:hypothetical protein
VILQAEIVDTSSLSSGSGGERTVDEYAAARAWSGIEAGDGVGAVTRCYPGT